MKLVNIFLISICIFAISCGNSQPEKNKEKQPKPEQKPNKPIKNPTPTASENDSKPKASAPAGLVAESDISVNWDENLKDEADAWVKARNAFVKQYIDNPQHISSAIHRPIDKRIADYLKRCYGSLWNPTERTRELEMGFLHCRLKEENSLQDNLALMKERGGKNYLQLVYVASWHYALSGKKDKATKLLKESDFKKSVPNYDLSLPMGKLEAELSK